MDDLEEVSKPRMGRPPKEESERGMITIKGVMIAIDHVKVIENWMVEEGVPTMSEAVRTIVREWVRGRKGEG